MRICILAAGIGSRMGAMAQSVHKALLPLNNQAVISRIIEQFSPQDEFVIAVGFKKDQIKDYLTIVYPQRRFIFVEVDNYDGPGSGPGYSLFACRDYLQGPFVFTACDTLISSPIPSYQDNWMGVQKVDDIAQWCSVKIDGHFKVTDIFYKVRTNTDLAFVGIAFVKDYKLFWNGLEKDRSLLGGELQVNNGLEALVSRSLKSVLLEWQDTGNEENYNKLLKQCSFSYSFDGKITGLTYHHDHRVIKFFEDPKVSKLRYERALLYKGVFANVCQLQGSFYSYEFVQGKLLSGIINGPECRKFLNWTRQHLWKEISVDQKEFEKIIRQFYYQKTMDRLNLFCEKYLPQKQEEPCTINHYLCPTVAEMLNAIDGMFYQNGLPSTYHGDLHDDNVIVKSDSAYALIDWRESFGPSFEAGDRYYDLAKFLHTLNFSVQTMKNNGYEYGGQPGQITVKVSILSRCREAMETFWSFIWEKERVCD